jgi:hypothetical protein
MGREGMALLKSSVEKDFNPEHSKDIRKLN